MDHPTITAGARPGEFIITQDGVPTCVFCGRDATQADALAIWQSADQPNPAQAMNDRRAQIDAERDRRLALPFEFEGKHYQRDPVSIQRISGAGTLAIAALIDGAAEGDLRWKTPDRDFKWICCANSETPMDAQTMVRFGRAAAAIEEHLVFAAKRLKAMDPPPENFSDDSHWL